MLTFLLSVAVAVAVADNDDGCQISEYMRGAIDDIHLLVSEDMCTKVEKQDMQTMMSNQNKKLLEIKTMMSNHKTEIKTMMNNQNTEIKTIKTQMNKIISMLEKPGKSLYCIVLSFSIYYFDNFFAN